MLSDARQYIWTQPMLLFWPGLAHCITALSFTIVGHASRDRLATHSVNEPSH